MIKTGQVDPKAEMESNDFNDINLIPDFIDSFEDDGIISYMITFECEIPHGVINSYQLFQ